MSVYITIEQWMEQRMPFMPLDKNSAFVRSVGTPAARKRAHPNPGQQSLFPSTESTAIVDDALEDNDEGVVFEFEARATWEDLPEEERARKEAERDRVWAAGIAYDKAHLAYIMGFGTAEAVLEAQNLARAAWEIPLTPAVLERSTFKFETAGEKS
jgi:hypothetical protein